MIHQHYGTQTVNRGAVLPGMLVKHKEGTWTASANKRGKLYLHRGIERTYTTELLVEVFLNGMGNGLSNSLPEGGMQTKKCAYCGKPLAAETSVKATIVYVHGAQLARKENDYCSKQCAEHDQMAHES